MEDGAREGEPLLRSINNVHRSFVKFVNRTLHNVVLYWIDYQGQAVSYGALSPGDCLDIDTFVTHPWIFVDQETRDRQGEILLESLYRLFYFWILRNELHSLRSNGNSNCHDNIYLRSIFLKHHSRQHDNIHEQIPKLFILILQSVEYIEWCLDSFYVELDSDRDPSVAIKIEDELDFSLLTRSSSKYR